MKCFSWKSGRVSEGIELIDGGAFGACVSLGERGRGRHQEVVTLDRRRPPDHDGVLVYHAEFRGYEAGGKLRVSLTAPAVDTRQAQPVYSTRRNCALVRASTEHVYTRGASGRIGKLTGTHASILTSGHGAHGDAGRLGTWGDYLILLGPAERVELKPDGGYKSEWWVVMWQDGELVSRTREEQEQLDALTALEALDALKSAAEGAQ